MSQAISYKKVWLVAYPIILGSMAQNLINVTDTAFLGRVGEIELGASALGGMFYFVLMMIGAGVGTGAQIIIARRFGENDKELIGKTFDHILYLMLPIGIILFGIMFFFRAEIMRPLILSDQIYRASVDFLDFRMYGIVFALGQILFRSFYIGIANTKVITYSTIIMALVNIFLDYVLIFGHLSFPAMGLKGAAIASVIAEFIALLYLFIYSIRKEHDKEYKLFKFPIFDKTLFSNNLKLSYPIMIQNFLGLGVWFIFFLLVEKMGERELAISNIIRSAYIVIMIPIWGFSAAANSLVSFLMGLNRKQHIFNLIGKTIWMCLAGVGVFISISFLFPESVIGIYTNDEKLIQDTIPVLYVVNFAALALAVGFMLFNGLLGTGKTQVGLVIEILVLSIYLTYIYILIQYFEADVAMVWTSELVYGLMLAIFSWLYLKYGKW